jgi:photosystem II stability/assembly factor-like uncharacterized protein
VKAKVNSTGHLLGLACIASWLTIQAWPGPGYSHFRGSASPVAAVDAAMQLKVAEANGRAPLSFEANVGQTDDARVKFLSRGNGYNLFLTSTEATLAFFKAQRLGPGPADKERPGSMRRPIYSQSQVDNNRAGALRIGLSGASKAAKLKGVYEQPRRNNYFIGSDPRKWRTNVPTYSRVKHESIYPGVNLVYYGNQQQLEYDFIVAPGAHPEAIRLRFEGAQAIEIDNAGDLVIDGQAGEIRQLKPVAYQENNGARQEVSCRYVIRDRCDVVFQLGEYDASKPLTIDPVLGYATYLGSTTGPDFIDDIAIDSAGNAYVTGNTSSVNFPTTPGSFQNETKGSQPAFVTKLNPTGTAIIYSTYLGGSKYEGGSSIAVDSAGNAYVTGYTGSVDFPTTSNAFKRRYRGGFTDVFVTKLNPAGSALVYSTLLGGRGGGFETSTDIGLDAEGSAYITGYTESVDFPITTGAAQEEVRGGQDAFVTKLNAEGSALAYSTYLGGGVSDLATCIAVDLLGSAYVAGITASSDFPTRNAFQPSLNGLSNAFVTKLNPAGTRLVYSTFLGGGSEEVTGLALDAAGIVCVVGRTFSRVFPTTPGAFQPALSDSADLFITRLSEDGSELISSTYLGGSATETSAGVALDSAGNAYVTGTTSSFDFPLANPIQNRKSGSALFKTTDAGVTWTDVPLSLPIISSIVPDPQAPSTFYGLSGDRIIKSSDKGNSWTETGRRFANAVFFDPLVPSTIYGLTDMSYCRSTDGGATNSSFVNISPGNTLDAASGLVVDPKNPSTLYVSTLVLPVAVPAPARLLNAPARSPVFKSTDGGGTWFPLDLGIPMTSAGGIAIDPRNPSTLYSGVGLSIYRTTDEGTTWTARTTGFFALEIVIDPINTSTVYAHSFSNLSKTTDGGNTWRQVPVPNAFIGGLTISPKTPTTLYLTSSGILKSIDGGNHWEVILRDVSGTLTVDPDSESTLYLGRLARDDAFVTKINASGSAIVYSTYLGGFSGESGRAIAVDPFGNAYVAGQTESSNFPVTPNAFQKNAGNSFTGFIAKIIDPRKPTVSGASIKGKKLIVTGESFDKDAVILINNLDQETQNDDTLPSTVLISQKAGKKIAPGQTITIRVRNADGRLSDGFAFTRSLG